MRSFLLVAVLVAVAFGRAPAQPSASSGAGAAPSPPASTTPGASASATAIPSASAAPDPSASAALNLARERVAAMLRTGHADPAWFSADFLAQVPAARVDAVIAQPTGTLGAFRALESADGKLVARFAKGTDEVLIHLDPQRKIDGIFFRPPHVEAGASALDDVLRALRASAPRASAPRVSYLLRRGATDEAVLDPSAPLAVGSAFKLAVLAGLQDDIVAGRRRWDEVVTLDPAWKSLPSGVLQTWPDRAPLTVATMATEMISISDNTAADALIRLVSPAALARYAGRNDPFLTTREMFVLHSSAAAAQRSAFLAATTPAALAAILHELAALPLPAPDRLDTAALLPIEWHFSVRELCALMDRVADLPPMGVNPGVADAASFRRVAYKGGIDTGVLNMPTAVTTHRGTTFCLAATANDAHRPIDQTTFTAAYQLALAGLASR